LAAKTTEMLLASAISGLHRDGFERQMCKWLSSCLDYDNITALAYFQDRAPIGLIAEGKSGVVHTDFDRLYLTHAYQLDPFYGLHVEQAPPGLYRMSDIAPDQFKRNEYYRDFYSKTTMVDEIAFISYPSKGVSLHICLGRDACSNQRFSKRDLATAHSIVPLVDVLSRAHWKDLTPGGKHTATDTISSLITALGKTRDISLSPRQAEVALLILRGHSSVSIALRLGISPQTVKVFRKQLYKKCLISSQAELFSLLVPLLGVQKI
jgi:DNA-binding CsgD family transcriptional regulator